MEKTLDSLVKDIKKVAWESSPINYLKVAKVIKKEKRFVIDEDYVESQLSDLI